MKTQTQTQIETKLVQALELFIANIDDVEGLYEAYKNAKTVLNEVK